MIFTKTRILLIISLIVFWYYNTSKIQTQTESIQQSITPSSSSSSLSSRSAITNYNTINENVDELYSYLITIPDLKNIIQQFQTKFYNIRYILAPFYKALTTFYFSMQKTNLNSTEIEIIIQNMQSVQLTLHNLEHHAYLVNRAINFANTIQKEIMNIIESSFNDFIINKTTINPEMYEINSLITQSSNNSSPIIDTDDLLLT
mgnify:CR=1 FL=1